MKTKTMAVIGLMVWCVMVSGVVWGGDIKNGTVTIGNLIWLQNAGCLGMMNWDDANRSVNYLQNGQCGLTDGSKSKAWRLPTSSELHNIFSSKAAFSGVNPLGYWSSNDYSYNTDDAVYVDMSDNRESHRSKTIGRNRPPGLSKM